MKVAREIPELRRLVAEARRTGAAIGFVPTMGALHAGHISLIEACRQNAGYCVVSVFVNPTQFAPGEDFGRYPRDESGDLEKCRSVGVDCVFAPRATEMFQSDSVTTINIGRLGDHLCGPFRPGHFVGVATVVAKLFNLVQPDQAFFGRKDAQQLAIIRRMVRDLDFPLEVVGRPTMREPDGLAMSSRNAYLSATERRQAASMYRALTTAASLIRKGETAVAAIEAAGRHVLEEAGPQRLDYFSIVEPEELQPVHRIKGPVLIAAATRIGTTRLIDNVLVDQFGQVS